MSTLGFIVSASVTAVIVTGCLFLILGMARIIYDEFGSTFR